MSNFISDYPHFANDHTLAQALGLACWESTIYYLSTAGPASSCKAIWASLVNKRSTLDCRPWSYDMVGASDIKTVYQPLPNSNFQHMVSLHKQPHLLLVVDPQAVRLTDAYDLETQERRLQLKRQHWTYIRERFVNYLSAETDVPVVAEWATELWKRGIEQEAIIELLTFGDCIGAWLVVQDFNWLDLVSDCLRRGTIQFPRQTEHVEEVKETT